MNKHLSREDLDTANALADLGAYFGTPEAPPRLARPHPGAPFNKRAEGRARRTERRVVRAFKTAYLNSEA